MSYHRRMGAKLIRDAHTDYTREKFFRFYRPYGKSMAGGITQQPRNIGPSNLFLLISGHWFYGVQLFEKNAYSKNLNFRKSANQSVGFFEKSKPSYKS